MKYINLDRKIIEIIKESEDTNIQTYLIPVYLFISCKVDKLGEVDTNIEKIVTWCGLKPSRREGKSNDKIKQILTYLINNKFISCDKDINTVKSKELFTIYYDEEKLDLIKINVECIRTILNEQGNFFIGRLLTYFCYTVANSVKVNDKYLIYDNKKMANEIGISLPTIIKYNAELFNLDLITLEKPKQEKSDKVININVSQTILNKSYNILQSRLTKPTLIKLSELIEDFGEINIINAIDNIGDYDRRYINNTEFNNIIHKENTFLIMIRQNLPYI